MIKLRPLHLALIYSPLPPIQVSNHREQFAMALTGPLDNRKRDEMGSSKVRSQLPIVHLGGLSSIPS